MSDPRHVDIVYRLRQPVAHTTSELVGVAHLHAEAADRIVVLEGALGHAEAEVERLRAGGCARDQKTTQWCAEAEALRAERDALRANIETMRQAALIDDWHTFDAAIDAARRER